MINRFPLPIIHFCFQETYYVPAAKVGGNKTARGKLYNKYNAVRQMLMRAGTCEPLRKKGKKDSTLPGIVLTFEQ